MPELRIGISGWTYAPWRGVFFPPGVTQKQELAYASRQVNAIEINGSFYSLQHPKSYGTWYEQTPPGFVFAVKGGRFITHMKRLTNVEKPLANFFASGLLRLNEKLGPILWQLPPQLRFHETRLASFFKLLPRDTRAAAALARRHDEIVAKRSWTRIDQNRPLRHCLEVRHPSFKCEAFVTLLREHDIGLVVADTAGKWPFMEDVTSDFIYVRLHGDEQLYVSGYTDKALEEWARKIRLWARGKGPSGTRLFAPPARDASAGRSVYVFFDNDVKVRAPYDAMSLAHKLGLGPKPDAPPEVPTTPATTPRTRWPGFGKREGVGSPEGPVAPQATRRTGKKRNPSPKK
jgi:uncharacterized protein YecE (DUF72 family)